VRFSGVRRTIKRDLEFARKYELPVTPVVCADGQDAKTFSIADTAMTAMAA